MEGFGEHTEHNAERRVNGTVVQQPGLRFSGLVVFPWKNVGFSLDNRRFGRSGEVGKDRVLTTANSVGTAPAVR